MLTVTDDEGGTGTDTVAITVSEPPPPAETDHLANAEVAGAGTLSGDYTMTWADDAGSQSVTERVSGGKRNRRYSYLVHTWQFSVTAGASITVYANAWSDSSTDGDSFRFEWSTSANSGFQTLFTVDNSSGPGSSQVQLIDTTGTLSGPVFIRVVDTNSAAGNTTLDTVHVDHLYIKTVTAAGDPPAAPSNLAVSAPTSSSLTLGWTDNSGDETGFKIGRSTDGSNFSPLITLPADTTSHTDTSLSGNTRYWYRVSATSASGVSTPSNIDSGTTLTGPAITLSAVGYKVKGKQQVDLSWGGTGDAVTNVDIYRVNMVDPFHTTDNDGVYTDNIGVKGGGSYVYKVCEAGSSNCSDPVTVIF
jgi:serine protease